MLMLSDEIKNDLNSRVLADCKINGEDIVKDRMTVREWTIEWHGEFIERFTGDSYDVQQRKAELQRIVEPIYRVKQFTAFYI